MGVYVYQVTKGANAVINGEKHEIGKLKYYTKPYFHIWNDATLGCSSGYTDRFEKRLAKSYRLFFARQKRVRYRRYVVHKLEEGEYVYEMPVNSTWSYDTPTIGLGIVGKLVYNDPSDCWDIDFIQIAEKTDGRTEKAS